MASLRVSAAAGVVPPAGPGGRGVMWAVRTPLLVAIPVLAATVYVALVNPFDPGHYPPCPWLSTFGIYCPGCGGLRAVHALTHGHPLQALDLNAFGLLLCAALAALWVYWLVARLTARQLNVKVLQAVLFTAVVVLPIFTVVRNLPFGQLLAP